VRRRSEFSRTGSSEYVFGEEKLPRDKRKKDIFPSVPVPCSEAVGEVGEEGYMNGLTREGKGTNQREASWNPAGRKGEKSTLQLPTFVCREIVH